MFRLQRYFTITSLIAFILIAFLLGYFFRVSATADLLNASESKNIALTQSFSNFLWPEFADFVDQAGELEVEELQNHPRIDELYALVAKQLNGLTVVKIKVYDMNGLTVFSTEKAQIGDSKLDNAGYLSARDGIVASELTFRDSFSAFEQTIEDRNVFSSYLPIYGPNGEIEGVFEVYDDVTPLVEHLDETQRNIVVGVSIILAILYIVLFLIVHRADRIIQQQYNDLIEKEADLRQARDEALAASKFKSRLLANVSHDMRTPISSIMGYAEMLEVEFYGAVNDKQRQVIRDILRSTGILMDFVSNLLDQARIESGKLELANKPVAPQALVDDVAAQVDILARAKGLSFAAEISDDMPNALIGDRYWLRQIMMNLVSNAIKFTNRGTVHLQLLREDENWLIQVKDTGNGIPEDARERIFSAFEQGSNGYVGSTHGAGLGLSIVKEMSTLMNGQVSLESEIGAGTTFTVTLPLHVVESEAV